MELLVKTKTKKVSSSDASIYIALVFMIAVPAIYEVLYYHDYSVRKYQYCSYILQVIALLYIIFHVVLSQFLVRPENKVAKLRKKFHNTDFPESVFQVFHYENKSLFPEKGIDNGMYLDKSTMVYYKYNNGKYIDIVHYDPFLNFDK